MERMPEMQSLPLERAGDSSVGIQLEDYLNADAAEDAVGSLIEILRDRPELQQYITGNNLANAKSVIKRLRLILEIYPEILTQLAQAAESNKKEKGELAMAILPKIPLVLIQDGEDVVAFAPVLTCTLNAISDLTQHISPLSDYVFAYSSNGLVPYVVDRLKQEDNPVISYHPETMNPLDYIALGATGMFSNETFRVTLPKSGRIHEPE